MISLELKRYILFAIPFLLIPSAGFMFVSGSKWLGKEKGYLLGFLFYWTIWGLLIPLILLGTQNFPPLFVDGLGIRKSKQDTLPCWEHVDRLTTYGMRKKIEANLWKEKHCENL